jgi:hypothetical protein
LIDNDDDIQPALAGPPARRQAQQHGQRKNAKPVWHPPLIAGIKMKVQNFVGLALTAFRNFSPPFPS